MIINKAYKFQLYPNNKQRRNLSKYFRATRFVYNYFLREKTDYYQKTKKNLTYNNMAKKLTEIKKHHKLYWLNQVSAQCLQQTLKDLDRAFKNFFKKLTDYPKEKRDEDKKSFRLTNQVSYLKDNKIHIPYVGLIKIRGTYPKDNSKLLSITISQKIDKYYASISVKERIDEPVIDKSKPTIGLDFGLKTFITTSDGEKIEHPEPGKKAEKKLKKLSRKISRSKKGGRNRDKKRKKLAILHQKVAQRRTDYLHKLSRKMISRYSEIKIEDLNLEGMKQKWGRKVSDLGWNEFSRQLQYKGLWYGCKVTKINRFYPSSKLCSECGFKNNDLKLIDREWKCSACGTVHDRDVNAAKNILNYPGVPGKVKPGEIEASKDQLMNQEAKSVAA